MLTNYELTFVIDPISEELEDYLTENVDAMIASHSGLHVVTMSAPGSTGLEAAKSALEDLRAAGVTVHRLDLDLVSQANIATRTGKSRQAVSNWVSGQRQICNQFPRPFTGSTGPLWLWSDVNEWLRRTTGLDHDGFTYPGLEDIQKFNSWLDEEARSTSGKVLVRYVDPSDESVGARTSIDASVSHGHRYRFTDG